MKLLMPLLSAILLTVTVTTNAEELTLDAGQDFKIKASFYQSDDMSDRAVLLLHQCNYNRTMYDGMGKQLAEQGIYALSMDFRGFGESVNEQFSVEKIQALPREERRAAWQKMSAHWPTDVQLAYNHLASKLTDKGVVGVIGASCGGAQAITLAEKNDISLIGFFSSNQREENIARYKKVLAQKPTLIIASEKDTGTYESAQQLFTTADNDNSKFISYKGSEHGYPLLDKDKHLAGYIVAWLDSQL